jgi:hypothetical protein
MRAGSLLCDDEIVVWNEGGQVTEKQPLPVASSRKTDFSLRNPCCTWPQLFSPKLGRFFCRLRWERRASVGNIGKHV